MLGGRPRMITTLRKVEPGTDGAISLAGTLAGVAAAAIVAVAGTLALRGDRTMFCDQLRGRRLRPVLRQPAGSHPGRRGWLNNDAVNFLSTASAAAFALGLLAVLPHPEWS